MRIRPGHVHRGNRGLDVPITNVICLTNSSLSIPAFPIRKWSWRRSMCFHMSRRPADLRQPAIGLLESAFLALSRWTIPVPMEPCVGDVVLQRPAREKVALVSRVSKSRTHPEGLPVIVCEANVSPICAGARIESVLSRQRLSLWVPAIETAERCPPTEVFGARRLKVPVLPIPR